MPSPQPIRLVVFDWAGTMIDFGSCAPAAAFRLVFEQFGVEVSDAVARGPMGANKRDHLAAMLGEEGVSRRWRDKHGRDWTEADVDAMYEAFVPLQMTAIRQNAALVPGIKEAAAALRSQGVAVAGTTGYFREAAEAVLAAAKDQGFGPDSNFCADDVPQGRPKPWMIFRAMEAADVHPPAAVAKVGDTLSDVRAGVAAGCWSLGVVDSSSLMGLSEAEFAALGGAERDRRRGEAAARFREAGAHATVYTVAGVPEALRRLESGGGVPA